MFKNQKELFAHIWASRPHISEISGCLLFGENHPLFFWQFSHTLSKGAFPKFKLKESNIVLMTPAEHTLLTEHPEKTKLLPEWKTYWEEYELLRIEYFKK